jgi:hypothetical protein
MSIIPNGWVKLEPIEGPSQLIVKGKTQKKQDKQTNQYLEVIRKDFNVDVKGQKVKVSYYSPIDR